MIPLHQRRYFFIWKGLQIKFYSILPHFQSVGHAAGWIIPLAWLISNERIRDYGCNAERAAAEYFSKACAPGAQSAAFQVRDQENYWEYSHLCDLCHGTAGSYCHRNHMEDYYGHTGAFRYFMFHSLAVDKIVQCDRIRIPNFQLMKPFS